MAHPTVLLIEDEKDVVELVRFNLEKNGFDVIAVSSGAEGLTLARKHAPDLILLDLMMPEMDGIEVCRQLRSEASTARLPVVMLTAKAAEADRILGLEMGADDYIVKPFSPRELVARVKAVLRRASRRETSEAVIRHGDLTIDSVRHEITFREKALTLTATEYRILEFLAAHPGRVFPRGTLIDDALGRDEAVTDRTIDVHVTAIRRKLGRASVYIETVRGFGYRFNPGALESKARSGR